MTFGCTNRLIDRFFPAFCIFGMFTEGRGRTWQQIRLAVWIWKGMCVMCHLHGILAGYYSFPMVWSGSQGLSEQLGPSADSQMEVDHKQSRWITLNGAASGRGGFPGSPEGLT